ncbi:MAG: hypothetical protein ACP5VQ_11535 [Phycisphaerae bacterium]
MKIQDKTAAQPLAQPEKILDGIITAWPELPEHIRMAIQALIQASR